GYFDNDVWVRGLADVIGIRSGEPQSWPTDTGLMLDWKTGKRRVDELQLKILGTIAFAYYPTLNEIDSGYFWLQARAVDKVRIKRSEQTSIWSEILPRVTALEQAYNNANMPAREGPLCRYCPVTSCAYNAKGR